MKTRAGSIMKKLFNGCITFIIVFITAGCSTGGDLVAIDSPESDPATQMVEATVTPIATQIPPPFTPTAGATPTHVYALGEDVKITPGDCFDFDSGQVVDENQPGCDFTFQQVSDITSRNILFQPYSRASFAFTQAFWDAPDEQNFLPLLRLFSIQ
jgi:hypothetical protein